MKIPDDSVAKRAKLSDSQSSSSSSHFPQFEIVPKLRDSSGETGDAVTRESATKKARVGADMDVSAIEARTNAKLEVDRALDTANKTLHHLREEIPLESEVVNTSLRSQEHQRQEGVFTEVYENEADGKAISGKWVLKPHKARHVPRVFRGRREERRRLLRQHDDDSISENASLFAHRSQERRLHRVADVKTVAQWDGDVVYARPPPE